MKKIVTILIIILFMFTGCSSKEQINPLTSKTSTGNTNSSITEVDITKASAAEKECEAFEIMSGGQYIIELYGPYMDVALKFKLCQKEKIFIMIDCGSDGYNYDEYVLITENGNYSMDVKTKQYNDYPFLRMDYRNLICDKDDYKFISYQKNDDEEIYTFQKEKTSLEYHYRDNEFKKLVFNENKSDGYNLIFDVLSFSKSVPDNLIFDIPDDYEKHVSFDDRSDCEHSDYSTTLAKSLGNLSELIEPETLSTVKTQNEAEQTGFMILEKCQSEEKYKHFCLMSFTLYQNNIWEFYYIEKEAKLGYADSLIVYFDGNTGMIISAWEFS